AITGLRTRSISGQKLSRLAAAPLRRHELHWEPLPRTCAKFTIGRRPGEWLVYCGEADLARRWRDELDALGREGIAVIDGHGLDSPGERYVRAEDEADVSRLFAQLRSSGGETGGLIICPGAATAASGAGGLLDEACQLTTRAALVLKHYLK